MCLTKRYGLLLLMLACFQSLFFVPIFFAPNDIDGDTLTHSMQMLLGGSPFFLHYQSIGLLPIVMASLSVTLLPMIDSRIGQSVLNKYKDPLVYVFGFFMALGVVHRTNIGWDHWRAYAVLIELVGSIQIIVMIIKFTEKLEITSSPVVVFFAWNVLTGAALSAYNLFSATHAELWLLTIFSLCLMLFTLYACHHFLSAKRDVTVAYIAPDRGFQVSDKIRMKAAQVSILPVVLVMMGLGSISVYLFEAEKGLSVLHHPVYFCIFLLALWFTVRAFTLKKINMVNLSSHIESTGGKVVTGNKIQINTYKAIKTWTRARIWEQWFVLSTLMVMADLANMWLASAGLPPVTFVAGLGGWILVNAFLDMRKQYDKLSYIYL